MPGFWNRLLPDASVINSEFVSTFRFRFRTLFTVGAYK